MKGSSSALSAIRSILLITSTTGVPAGSMRRISLSPLPQLPASTTSRITSTSAKVEVTLRFIRRLSAFLCVI